MEPTLDDFKHWIERELPLVKESCRSPNDALRKEADYRYDALLGAQKSLLEFERKGRTPLGWW